MRGVITAFYIMLTVSAFAQSDDKLFGPADAPKPRRGFILNGNAQFDIPAGDMAKRFGYSYRIGPGVLYKNLFQLHVWG